MYHPSSPSEMRVKKHPIRSKDPETINIPGEGTNMVPPVPGYTRENGVLGVDAEIWLIQHRYRLIKKKTLQNVERSL